MMGRERFAWAAAAFLTATTILTAMLAARHAREAVIASVPTRSRIDAPRGTVFVAGGGPVLSPDGRSLAFCVSDVTEETVRLWLRPLDALEGHALPGTDGASAPFWSPDGKSLGLFFDGALWTVPRDGGPPAVLVRKASPLGGAWSPGGFVIFAPSDTGGLAAIRPGTDGFQEVTRPAPGVSHRWPSFLPDGNHFVYVARSGDSAVLRLGSLDGREDRDLFPTEGAAAYVKGHMLHPLGDALVATPFHVGQLRVAGDAVPVASEVLSASATGAVAFTVSNNGFLVYVPRAEAPSSAVLITNWDPDVVRRPKS